MHGDYYLNTLYPFQDKILSLISALPVDFYLTGGTALGRYYLNHRYSDDLDFFVNDNPAFKSQLDLILKEFRKNKISYDVSNADEGFARLFVTEGGCILKLDFVNDIPFHSGNIIESDLFIRTDSIINILSNKISALGRLAPKDVIDIIFIADSYSFDWKDIIHDAAEKDVWVNPPGVAEILEQFPVARAAEIIWKMAPPSESWLKAALEIIIRDLLEGTINLPGNL